jgi:hypothetical protein
MGNMRTLHAREFACAVAAVATVTAGLAVCAVSGLGSEHDARAAAVDGFQAQSGLANVEVVRAYVSDSCAVVQLHHPAMKYGVTSVALSKVDGHWQVRVIQDDDRGISFDPDDADGGCQDILRAGGRRR